MDNKASSEARAKADALLVREHARMLECRCRGSGTCALMIRRLGWVHGMPIDDCDVCWSLGGERAEEAELFRAKNAAAVVGAFTRQALDTDEKPPREILVALTVFHRTITEDRFSAPDMQNAVKAPIRWVHVRSSWEKAESFLRAAASKLLAAVSPFDRGLRQQACFGETLDGDRVGPRCQLLKEGVRGFYCGACGCGERKLAIIGTLTKKGVGEPSKLDFPDLQCPLEKEGFSNGRRL